MRRTPRNAWEQPFIIRSLFDPGKIKIQNFVVAGGIVTRLDAGSHGFSL
jgi:hypothetical protein